MATILCVDDEPSQLTLLQYAFKRNGFEVICANNGDEAVKVAKENQPDIILMDLMMPVKDGAQATVEIKAISSLKAVPVVLFSAYDKGNLAKVALNAGAVEIIRKTTPPTELVAKINQILGQ